MIDIVQVTHIRVDNAWGLQDKLNEFLLLYQGNFTVPNVRLVFR